MFHYDMIPSELTPAAVAYLRQLENARDAIDSVLSFASNQNREREEKAAAVAKAMAELNKKLGGNL